MKKVIVLSLLLLALAVLLFLGRKSISTEIIINVPAHLVWSEFTDFKSYPQWNPFLRKLTGNVKEGNTIEVTFQIRDSDPVVFSPRILKHEKDRIFQWEGRLLMPGIFTGKHTFELMELEENKTRLVQREDFNGILVPFFDFDSTIEGFELMNQALKERVEKNK